MYVGVCATYRPGTERHMNHVTTDRVGDVDMWGGGPEVWVGKSLLSGGWGVQCKRPPKKTEVGLADDGCVT